MILLVLAIIGLLLILGISFIVFFLFKRFGKEKLGRVIGIGLFIVSVLVTVYVVFEDAFFFKSTARKELQEMNIVLIDDFEIIDNETGGFTDYFHIFKLKISDKDKERLIQVKNANDEIVIVKYIDFGYYTYKAVKVDTKENILIYEYIQE